MDDRQSRKLALQAELRRKREAEIAANGNGHPWRGLIAVVACFVALVLLVIFFDWVLLVL